jgi:hypothetical protein
MPAIIFLLSFFISSSGTWAADSKTPLLEVKSVGHYGTQTTLVFQHVIEKREFWVCRTELISEFETPRNPVNETQLKSLFKSVKSRDSKSCRDTIQLSFHEGGKKRELSGCRADAGFSQFMDELDRNCGR